MGKTTLVHALSATGQFVTGLEDHTERPFQFLFKQDPRYALANQMDYLIYRAEQERTLRDSPQIGLLDGGLDLDFHCFTRLFHRLGLLTDPEFDLCRRFYEHTRALLPPPEFIIRLTADEITVADRLSARERINIAKAEDTALFNSFLDEWLADIPSNQVLELDVSFDDINYSQGLPLIFTRLRQI